MEMLSPMSSTFGPVVDSGVGAPHAVRSGAANAEAHSETARTERSWW